MVSRTGGLIHQASGTIIVGSVGFRDLGGLSGFGLAVGQIIFGLIRSFCSGGPGIPEQEEAFFHVAFFMVIK